MQLQLRTTDLELDILQSLNTLAHIAFYTVVIKFTKHTHGGSFLSLKRGGSSPEFLDVQHSWLVIPHSITFHPGKANNPKSY